MSYPTPATFDQVRGGGERYVVNIARGVVQAAGGEAAVEIVAPAPAPSLRTIANHVTLRGVPVWPANAGYGHGVSWDLVEALSDSALVHVHQAFTRYGETAVLAARLLGRAVCITDHGGGTSELGRRLGIVDVVDATIAYSAFGAQALGNSSNVRVVRGGVDAEFFRPTGGGAVRDRFVFAGRIMPHKGVDILLRAAPPDIDVTIAGTIGEPEYFDLVSAIAQTRQATFVLDPDDDALRALYSRAIAVVQPSVHVDVYGNVHLVPELMGLAALEGMACGAPAVVMRTGALGEYVEDGVTGFVVASEDHLRERLALLALDRPLAERMGRTARERVRAQWDSRVTGREMLKLYRQLLAV